MPSDRRTTRRPSGQDKDTGQAGSDQTRMADPVIPGGPPQGASPGDPLATLDSSGQPTRDPFDVRLQRSRADPTPDQALWVAIRNRTQAIGFNPYRSFIDSVLCDADDGSNSVSDFNGNTAETFGSPTLSQRRANLLGRPTIHGIDAYRLLKVATEAFMLFRCGVFIDDQSDGFDAAEEARRIGSPVDVQATLQTYLGTLADSGTLPYLDRIAEKLVSANSPAASQGSPFCEGGLLNQRLTSPCLLELIWCYWQEEGMLVQTMNSIAFRFQNRANGPHDPLANLELDPLRPLSNLIWGFVQDAPNRLNIPRRASEYDHQYGISLIGKAVGNLRPADSRRRFIEAFHNLLYRAMLFYREDDDTTVIADAFSLLNALREVHILLAEGAQNQAVELAWKARGEMLMMQWLLARPEIREFIRGRYMVPYQELWMGAVDDMKRLQGWTDVSVTHFRELATYGEQILLSVRYGDWIDINDQELARNWARYWRPEIQRYIHAYNAVTGVDLSVEISDTRMASNRSRAPGELIAERMGRRAPASTLGRSRGRLAAPRPRQAELLEAEPLEAELIESPRARLRLPGRAE